MNSISELRQDLVTGDWVVIATGRAKRPDAFKTERHRSLTKQALKDCPFEDPEASGNEKALLALPDARNWQVSVITNKFPAFAHGECSVAHHEGPYTAMEGAGFHEVFIYRDHSRPLAALTDGEMELVIAAFCERYGALREEDCIEYISMFHNHGPEAGGSIEHPHAQLIAIPVIPPEVVRSLKGSKRYFDESGRCVHCVMIRFELETRARIVVQSEHFVAFVPYAARTAFETRIFPKEHAPSFRNTPPDEHKELGALLRDVLAVIARQLNDPPLNFYIHTTPVRGEHFPYYHWHIEILPKTAVWAGFELGTGMEISTISPEAAATYLREMAL